MRRSVPNILTVIRVCLIPFFVFFYLYDFHVSFPLGRWIALLIFILASYTDHLDGKIARKYNFVSTFGKFMDPLADKLLVCSALILFVQDQLIPAWLLIIIVGREFIISGLRLLAADEGIVIAAGPLGKLKTVFQMAMTIALLIHLDFNWFHIIESVLTLMSLILTLVSMIDYIWRNRALFVKKV